jgi:hypothetical protein
MKSLEKLTRTFALSQFIETTIQTIYTDFISELTKMKDLCSLTELHYNDKYIPDYSKSEVQQFYLLRYFPAYVAEYFSILWRMVL